VTQAIADARGVTVGETCHSPARHSAFHNPRTLLEFAAKLRGLSGGKPVGIKMCVGNLEEVAELIMTSQQMGLYLDYIQVDGKGEERNTTHTHE
jgi:glutamate synthase domain-containing protein 2